MTVINPFDFFLEIRPGGSFRYEGGSPPSWRLSRNQERGPLLMRWLAEVDRRSQPTVDFWSLNRRLCQDIAYVIRLDPASRPGDAAPASRIVPRHGRCWCRSCATWDSRLFSPQATWCSSRRT
jgi:hypothetical protein